LMYSFMHIAHSFFIYTYAVRATQSALRIRTARMHAI
jgi:hypothetical protein